MTEATRRATSGDVARLVELHRAAIEQLRGEKGGPLWVRQAGSAAGEARFDLSDPSQLVLAGTIDDAVIGYARVVVERLDDGGELAVLTDIYVEQGAREVGVGEALLDDAIEWAQARGCVGIDSVALPGMRATKNFFESAGLVARAIVVHKALR